MGWVALGGLDAWIERVDRVGVHGSCGFGRVFAIGMKVSRVVSGCVGWLPCMDWVVSRRFFRTCLFYTCLKRVLSWCFVIAWTGGAD